MSSTTTTAPIPTPSDAANGGGGSGSGGPTSSPLLFFVALGFGVVFTNLWIIVGVKYCFRYNQRNRAAHALGENGEPIDLNQVPRGHRRRREKKLMSMEEVNQRFPLIKYKAFQAQREADGLPAAGGVTAPPSRAGSIRDEDATVREVFGKQSTDTARPQTALSVAQHDHVNAINVGRPSVEATSSEKVPETGMIERTETADTMETINLHDGTRERDEEEEDEDDPIRNAAPPEMLATPGDTCAICLDNLDDEDDVRGLTCGHAFHAACVDPWLTSRRACCPLCKADYYVPKPRAEGDDTDGSATNRRRMPINPPAVWISTRGAVPLRPRLLLAGPRFFLSDSRERVLYGTPGSVADNTTPSNTTNRERDAFYEDPATQRAADASSSTNANRNTTWRSRLPNLPSMPRFGRRSHQAVPASEQGPVEETGVTAGELEAGTRRT